MTDPRAPHAPQSAGAPQSHGGCAWCAPGRVASASAAGRLCSACEALYVLYTAGG